MVVVFPASMWAIIPIFLVFSKQFLANAHPLFQYSMALLAEPVTSDSGQALLASAIL